MKKINAVIIGLGGHMLGEQIPALVRNKKINIIGACDPSPKAHNAFRRIFPEFNDITIVSDVDTLLKTVEPDIAIVAVPHDGYYDIVAELCKRKIYFMKEKPLARNLAEAKAILSLPGFADYGFITAQRRYSELYQKAKLSVEKIGKPYLFHAVYKQRIDAPAEGWRGSKAIAGGGCLIDMGYHVIDQLVWWFGIPEKIHAQISTLAVPGSDYDAEDSATISFRYSNGLHGTILLSRAAGEKRDEFELYGSDGYIAGSKREFVVVDRQGETLDKMEQQDTTLMLDRQLDFFISRVENKEGFEDIQREHLSNMKFIDRCYKDAEDESYNTKEAEEIAHV
jgi:predicted dehydrogenase